MLRAIVTIGAIILVTGCIMEPEKKAVTKEYDIGPECLHEDSTTWTDTSESRHMSCVIGGN